MFISEKRYEEEKKLLERRMTEFEKTLHELYDEHLKLREKYNDILAKLNTITRDMSFRIGDMGK